MQATIRLFGTSSRGIETREFTLNMIEKSKKHSPIDRIRENLIFTTWEAMRQAKEVYGWDKVDRNEFKRFN